MRKITILLAALFLVACTKNSEPDPETGCGRFVQLWYKTSKPSPDTVQSYFVKADVANELRRKGEDGKVVLQNDTVKIVHRVLPAPCR